MDISIPLTGMEQASAEFTSNARAVIGSALAGGSPVEDSVALSAALLGLVKSSQDFAANTKLAIVENELQTATFAVFA